jgi:hypothetical protein
MGEPTEGELRKIAAELARLQFLVRGLQSNDLRVLGAMIDRAYDEALFQAQIVHETTNRLQLPPLQKP